MFAPFKSAGLRDEDAGYGAFRGHPCCEGECAARFVALARCCACSSCLRFGLCRCRPEALVCFCRVSSVLLRTQCRQCHGFRRLHPSCVRRHAHPVGLRHAPSFQQFGFQVPWVFSGNGFSGSMIGKAGSAGTEMEGISVVTAGLRGSGIEIDGLLLHGHE